MPRSNSLPNGEFGDSFLAVSTAALSYAHRMPSDSRHPAGAHGVGPMDWFRIVFRAFAPRLVPRQAKRLADRTADRLNAGVQRRPFRRRARSTSHQPVLPWSINPSSGTNPLLAARANSYRAMAAYHPHRHHLAAVESPAGRAVMEPDEKRNTHQREPARNAGRHHRGRPAR